MKPGQPIESSNQKRETGDCFLKILENESREQIQSVIGIGIASRSIVVGGGAIETRIARVLESEADVLNRPPRDIGDVSCASRVAVIRIAGHGARRKNIGIGSAVDVEISDGARIFVAEVILRVRLNSIEVMLDE
jgi:hypothetical protein